MSKTNRYVFTFLRIMAWIIFVGLSIEAGGLLVNFIVSIYNPAFVQHLYQKLDLSDLYVRNRSAFFSMYSFILAIAVLKAWLFYLVVVLVSKLNLAKPFNHKVSKQIAAISYYTFSIGLISHIARHAAHTLEHRGYDLSNLEQFWTDGQAFILMSAVIYVIATIFTRGVEIQVENDYTI